MLVAVISTARMFAQPPHKVTAELPAVVVFDEAQQAPVPDAPDDHTVMYAPTVRLSSGAPNCPRFQGARTDQSLALTNLQHHVNIAK
jgi:hypothetical protein